MENATNGARNGKLVWQPYEERDDFTSVPVGSVDARRSFARGALEFLTRVARIANPEIAIAMDVRMRGSLEVVRKRQEESWRSKHSRWQRILNAPSFYQPESIAPDNFNLMYYRIREMHEAAALEIQRYYPQLRESNVTAI